MFLPEHFTGRISENRQNNVTMCDFVRFEAPNLDAEEEERPEETHTFQPLGLSELCR